MKNKFERIQKKICIFFITIIVSLSSALIIHASYSPQDSIHVKGARTLVTGGGYSTWVTANYPMKLQSYNSVTNSAIYSIRSYYKFEQKGELYGDSVYVNNVHIGDFNTNNGMKDPSDEIWRVETLFATLHSGLNTFETRNIGGVGGESWQEIRINTFASPPEVRGSNGIWYEGEVSSGLRTWQSLYTDGKTGTTEGNKVQTSTGFMYYDKDEAQSGVNAYSSNPVGANSSIVKIVDQSDREYNQNTWKVMDNPGTYTIYSKTKDSSGLESNTGIRVVTVKPRNYSISYAGNGATSGSTPSQSCTVLHNCTLNNNGFKRTFTVSYHGNGGTPTKSNEVASATFLGWQDHNNFAYNGFTYPSYVFNFPYYANTPGDIGNAFGYDKQAGINHWLATTINNSNESRQSSPEFSVTYYMAHGGGDLNNAFGNNRKAFMQHFALNGYREGRSGAPTVTGTLNDTYPNRATVKNLSVTDGANLTLKAKWKDGSVTLPNATRPGYKIIGWYTSSNGGDKVGDVGDKYTPDGNTNIYAHWDKAPEITASDKIFYEGEYTEELWKDEVIWEGATAKDLEDGDITEKIKVIYDNVDVNVPGDYKVTYEVTDSIGQTVTKDIKVTVLYNNPPTITAEDRWFYVSEDVNEERLMERVNAEDIEDGNITENVDIIKNNVINHQVGVYEVTYEIVDAYGKNAITTVAIHIVNDVTDGDDKITYLRFIDNKYMNTLNDYSEWRTQELKELLEGSLSKSEDAEASQIWELSSEDIEKIQEFNSTHDFSSESNREFLEIFQYLIK